MLATGLRLLIAFFAVLAITTPALAEKRVALVIGNGAYKHAPALANPKNDAEGMAAALARLKFEVLSGTDLDKPAMERLLRAFAQKLGNADVALVFYAGHGLQVHGRNYLVPIDGQLEHETDLAFEAVPLDLVQGLMEQGQRTNIMILDACRDNPLARNLARSMGTRSTGIGRGLGETKAGVGTLIVYATQPGNVALDGDDKNSPFTAALLKHMEAPGLEIRQVITRVRNDVISSTRDRQVPWDSSSLRGDFYFMAAAAQPAPSPAPPPATPPRPAAPSAEFETLFWQSIKDSRNIGDFKAYLERFPSGVFAPLARIRIADLERAAAAETRRAEEERKKADGDRADAERKAREEARLEAERKRGQADAVARIAGQRLDQAKAALRQNKYPDARRLAEESAALAKEAAELSQASAVAQGVNRDLAAFRGELGKRIEARVAQLLREARGFTGARKFAEAEKRIEEAEELAPASATAARRELEAAQGRAEADAKKKAEDDARKKAEDEKKKAEEAKPTSPDPRKQAQIANSWYAPERKRGLIAFAHGKATLETGAVAALERLAASLQAQKDYKITLLAGADRSEGAAAQLQALSRARLGAIQQWLAGKGVAASAIRIAIGAARGEGAEFRIVSIAAETAPEKKKDDAPPQGAAPPQASSAAIMRRLTGAEWRGNVTVAQIYLRAGMSGNTFNVIMKFREGGRFEVNGTVLGAFGSFGSGSTSQASAEGSWQLANDRVCVTIQGAADGRQVCYSVAMNEDGSVTLTGNGFLSGKRFAR